MNLLYYWSKLFKRIQGKSIRDSKIARSAVINYGSNIVKSSVGKYSYCGYDCWIIEANIGAFCSLSNGVRIGGPSHPMDFVSTSPVFCAGKNDVNKNFYEHPFDPFLRTHIKNDVWIGENAIIKAGVTIENGAVIGMGSVVTKSVGPYEVWAGNPAKLIRLRFNEDTVSKLIESKWWDLDDQALSEVADSVCDVNKFLSKVLNK